MYEQDTIAAIATPPGEGGVAIVRVSGVEAENIATRIFTRSRGRNGRLKSHTLYHGRIRDPRSENVLDEVLLTIMRTPRSYTGEDVVEVHCHGGAFLVREILGVILSQGARQAEAGEFTKRAFLNGKVDLAQAEAVVDLIRARTTKGVELALNQARGELSKHIINLREELVDLMVQVEAAIDFPEEEIELLQRQPLMEKIRYLAGKLSAIADTYEWGRLFREGAKVCICGRPNVGKSSLLNALLGHERAIVTPVPGTTRDVVEESLNLNGLPVILWDTAGIRDTNDQIERLGVELSRQHLEHADVAIVVFDGTEPMAEEDKDILRSIGKKKHILAINKIDLARRLAVGDIASADNGSIICLLSAKSGVGIEPLKSNLRDLILEYKSEPSIAVTNVRHRSQLIRSAESLYAAVATLAAGLPPELAAVDLSEAGKALGEIIGIVTSEDILERIFENYCIGK